MAYYVRKLAKRQSQHLTLQSRNRNTQSRILNFLKNYYHHHHRCHRRYYCYICTCVCNTSRGMAISLSIFRKEVVFRVVPRELLKSCRRHFRDQAVYNRPWRDLLIADWIGPVINEGPWNAWTARDEPTDLPSNSLQLCSRNKRIRNTVSEKTGHWRRIDLFFIEYSRSAGQDLLFAFDRTDNSHREKRGERDMPLIRSFRGYLCDSALFATLSCGWNCLRT